MGSRFVSGWGSTVNILDARYEHVKGVVPAGVGRWVFGAQVWLNGRPVGIHASRFTGSGDYHVCQETVVSFADDLWGGKGVQIILEVDPDSRAQEV